MKHKLKIKTQAEYKEKETSKASKYIIWYDRVCLGVDFATFFMAGLDDENWGQAQIPVIIKKLALSKRKIGLTNVHSR